MTEKTTRAALFRWLGWFSLINGLIFAVISLRYLGGYNFSDSALAVVYMITAYIGYHVVLVLLPLLLVLTPVIILFPRKRLVIGLTVLMLAVLGAILMLDSLIWSQSRFHINGLTMKILGVQSWLFAGIYFLIGLVFESMLAKMVWNWLQAKPRRKGRLVATLVTLCFLTAQGIYAWADAAYYVPVTSLGQQLPVYKGFTAKKFMVKHGLVDLTQSRERELARRISQGLNDRATPGLSYPQNPLQCNNTERMNLLVILVDAMRWDMLKPEITPYLSRFADERAVVFNQHFSGGNSSRMGAFTFFYGLPPSYWGSFEATQRSAILLDQLQEEDYQLGVFTSGLIYRPVTLDRTAFANVPGLRLGTEPFDAPPWQRDRIMTDEWLEWLEQRNPDQPFFGFLFYDAPTARSHPDDYPVRFPVAGDDDYAKNFSQYQSSVHYDDSLIAEVLEDLKSRGLMDSTVVMISSDHGEEFNETGQGLDKHGSGYNRYQLQTPMLLAWPGMDADSVDYRTSHYDVAPTLMKRFFGCSNPASDFSSGGDLFDGQGWDWLVAGSYYNYAVLEPEQITITFPNGLYEVRDWDYQLMQEPEFNGDTLSDVMSENARFYER